MPIRSGKTTHGVLIGSLLFVIVVLVGFFVHTRSLYVDLEQASFVTDTQGDVLVEAPFEQRLPFFYDAIDDHSIVLPASGLALLGLVFVALALRRLGRKSRVPLGLMTAPVLLPLALGLFLGAFFQWDFQAWHRLIFETLTGRRLMTTDGCMPVLTGCSHLKAVELISTLAVALTCVVTAGLFVRAARHAWIVGERGVTASRPWALAALALFGLGAIGLVVTAPHAADHARVAGQCPDEWERRIDVHTSLDLYAMRVESCGTDPWAGYERALENHTVLTFQVYQEGWVSELPRDEYPVENLPSAEFAALIQDEVAMAKEIRDAREEPPAEGLALALLVDERTPTLVLREHLLAARAEGLVAIILFGQHHEELSLESVGSWTRRSLCPIGWIRVHESSEGVASLDDFATWGEILVLASELGTEPLDLSL